MLAALVLLSATPSFAEPNCNSVRLADIGWTDVAATTGVAERLLTESGIEAKVLLLSLPVALAGLKNQDIDVFLGNWMPTQENDVRPYLKDGSVEVIGQNLNGAKYTLAVPQYTYDAGLKSFADIAKFKEQLHGRIYGIEPGNDGNRLILDMISKGDFGLSGFELVESSEQGMLLTAKAAVARHEPIVFLGWAPHPMNNAFPMNYLLGGDKYFGANFGEAKVFTLARKGFAAQCPALAAFFQNLVFNIEIENQIMGYIIDDKMPPSDAARRWLSTHAKEKEHWLVNSAQLKSTSELSAEHSTFSGNANEAIANMAKAIAKIPAAFVALLFSFLVFLRHRSWLKALGVASGLMIIYFLGLWPETIQTLTLVFLSTLFCVAIGIPVGIWSSRHKSTDQFFNPILDMMQTLPTFVYLIPTLLLFGLGVIPGLISTVIFAVAAPIRLTRLGIRSVPLELVEVGQAFGASPRQTLFNIEIPHAWPLILEGISQCVMLSLSMVVIAALVGAEGLGAPVIRALNTVNLRMGAEAGAAIVILAAILDRSLRRSTHVGT